MCVFFCSLLNPPRADLFPPPSSPPDSASGGRQWPACCSLVSTSEAPSYWLSAALDVLNDCSLKYFCHCFPKTRQLFRVSCRPFSVCCFLFICEHFSAQFLAWPSPQHSLLVSPATWLSARPPTPRTELLIFSRKHSSLTFSSSSVMAAPSFSSLRPNTLWSSLILLFPTSHPVFQEIFWLDHQDLPRS